MDKLIKEYIEAAVTAKEVPSPAGFKLYLLTEAEKPVKEVMELVKSDEWADIQDQLNIHLEAFLVNKISKGARNSQGMIFMLKQMPGYSDKGQELDIKPPVFVFDIEADERMTLVEGDDNEVE